MHMNLLPVLTIAGSDCSGGAGIQADLKTMLAHGVYGMSAITALTAQNTTGVADIMEVTPQFLGEELDAIFTDIPPVAVKIGMVAAVPIIEAIAAKLAQYAAPHIVVDPVMVAASGGKLISDDAIDALRERLFPMAEVITPNLHELGLLVNREVRTVAEMTAAARELRDRYGCAVLAKGGHLDAEAVDVLVGRDGSVANYSAPRIDTANTHGTGCTLSSAIASNLAAGRPLAVAVDRAKAYVHGALAGGLQLGHGSGPLPHGFALASTYLVG